MFYRFNSLCRSLVARELTSCYPWNKVAFCGLLLNLVLIIPRLQGEPVAGEQTPATEPVADSAVVAEPVSPQSVLRFPHLRPFIGHILLATPNLQVVLTGVAALAEPSPWQRAVEAVFVRQGQGWQVHGAWSGLDLLGPGAAEPRQVAESSLQGPPNQSAIQPWHALSVDIGRSEDPAAAYASFIFGRDSMGEKNPLVVTWRLGASGDRLSVTFGANNATGHSPPKEATGVSAWRLRLHGQGALDLMAQSRPAVGEPAAFAVRHGVNSSGAILGYQKLVHLSGAEPVLGAKAESPRPPLDGYEFLLTPPAVATAWARSALIHSCLYGVDEPRRFPSAAAKLDWLDSCTPQVKTGTVLLTMAEDEKAPGLVMPVYIFAANGQLLQALMLGVNQRQLSVSLPPGSGYLLADTPAGRRIAATQPFAVTTGTVTTMALPPRSVGQLEVSWPQAKSAAARIIVESTTGDDLSDHVVDGPVADVARDPSASQAPLQVRVSPRAWMVNRPVFRTSLLAGHYRVTVLNHGGVICQQHAEVASGRLYALRCPAFVPVSWPRVLSLADLSLPSDGAATGEERVRPLLAQALGVSMLGVDGASGLEPDHGNAKASGVSRLPMLSVSDAGQSLYFWPTTASLTKRWDLALRQAPINPLQRFARFLQDEQAGGVIELGCPAQGQSPREYKVLVGRFKPTALRLIGCRSSVASTAEWLSLWAQLAAQASPPLLLTTDANAAIEAGRPFPPLLSFEGLPAPESPALAAGLLERRFNVSLGATAALRGLVPARRGGSKEANAIPGVFDLTFSLFLVKASQELELTVFTEHGKIKRALLPTATTGSQLVSVAGLKLGNAAWLRVEVHGKPAGLLAASAGEVFDDSLLAATQFISISSLRGGAS